MSQEGRTENKKNPFQRQSFRDFIGLIARLFYDDACIVLLDFLALEQKAFLEADLREKLGWRDALIQQKLYLLEKHMLVVQDTSTAKGPRAPVYWRISHLVYSAVRWRLNQLIERLTKLVDDAHRQQEFECSKADCDARFTALEAAACSRALDDEHPLCNKCGSQLKQSEFEETKQQAKDKQSRAIRQLGPLERALLRVANMDIPVFPQHSKSGAVTVVEDGETQTSPTLADTAPVAESTDESSPLPSSPAPTLSTITTTSDASFADQQHPRKPSEFPITRPSQAIPWFAATRNAVTAQNNLITRPQQAVREASSQQQQMGPAVSKISFGLKVPNRLDVFSNLTPRLPSLGPVTKGVNAPAVPTPLIVPQKREAPITAKHPRKEIEIEVKQLNKKFKLSEITEEIEQKMSDEEYRVYYCAAEDNM